jgi:AGZA family xanthine/uracil permease-like MFS transporter
MKILEKLFKISERKSNTHTEIIAGLTTFAAMAYIIFLQPAILSGSLGQVKTGMPEDALFTATCLVAAFGSLVMGFLANYPAALAPGMGENFFFVTVVTVSLVKITGLAPASPELWQTGLAVVFVSGCIFAILSFLNIRQFLVQAVSPSMRNAILVGIGLFIAELGLINGEIVKVSFGYFSLSKDIVSPGPLVFMVGLVTAAILSFRKIKGALLIGIGCGLIVALLTEKAKFAGIYSTPPSALPVFCKFNFSLLWTHFFKILPLIIIFVYMDVFDTLGCLLGLSEQAGMNDKNGDPPDLKRAFASDALSTMGGSLFGNSTVTVYLESSAGIKSGGKTGLTATVTAICFLLALFFSPIIKTAASFKPITAPALVLVGVMMITGVKKIDWDDMSEALPAFLIILGIPFTSSIADGMMLGFIVYPFIKLFCGKGREIGFLSYFLAVLMLLYLIFVRI